MERLDKLLCAGGGLTRSQARLALKAGRVTVDGRPEKDGSRKLDPAESRICLDGSPVGEVGRIVVLMHKPAGYITSTQDPRDRTVMELLPPELRRLDLKPVGRLDKDTEGLLLFTGDGALLHKLIAPRRGIQKTYEAKHEGEAGPEDVAAFAKGLVLRDGTRCLPARLEPLGPGLSRITIQEGKYHQVRRMMAARQMTVTYLKRISEGGLTLGELPLGQTRKLTEKEIDGLLTGENDEGNGVVLG